MKNEKKPMRNKRFLLHILQQIAAFGMVSGVAFLVLFSFVMDDSVTKRFDIFPRRNTSRIRMYLTRCW